MAMASLCLPSAQFPSQAALQWTSLTKIVLQPEQNWPSEIYNHAAITGCVGSRSVALIADPETAKLVLTGSETQFPKWRLYERVTGTGRDSLLAVTGAQWHRQRRAFNPIFSPANVGRFVPIIHRAISRTIATWNADRNCVRQDISLDMTRLALDVMWRVLFECEEIDPPTIVDRAAVQIHAGHFNSQTNVIPTILAELADEAARRSQALSFAANNPFSMWAASVNEARGGDLSQSELYDNARAFLFAGHETTALTLTWALWLVAQDLATQQRLHEELDRVVGDGPINDAHMPQLIFIQQVLRETLRLFPSGFVTARQSNRPIVLADKQLPEKTILVICIYALHRHHNWWRKPDVFLPDRFGADEPRHRYAYLPFSAGQHSCIGAAFAWKELVTIIATILQRFRISTEDTDIKARFALTLRPDRPVPITLHKR